MNVVVTGCAGLIGANFCEFLIKQGGYTVFGIDDLSGGFRENVAEGVNFLKADLTNREDQVSIEEIFSSNKIDYIFNFAAYAAEGLSPFIRQYNYMSNTVANAFLINMAIKYSIRRFIFTSSMATYGENSVPFVETMQPNPIDPYGIAKYACEMDLRVANKQHNLSYVIIRPHNVIGKYQNLWDPYRNVLGIWMYKALRDEPFTIYGDGEQTRAFTCIDNILQPLLNAALRPEADTQIINLGGIHEMSINDAAELVKKITGTDKIIHLDARHEVKHAWSSFEKSVELLDYKESMSLEEGLRLMWEWAQAAFSEFPDRKLKYWDNYELEKDIYSYWVPTSPFQKRARPNTRE
jgi:UDP-glucose 4-epimerase